MNHFKYFLISAFISLPSFALIHPWVSSLPENSQFLISEKMSDRVDFWVKIYSYYTTSQGVFHLVDDPSFILGEVDLTPVLENSVLSPNEKYRQAQKLVSNRRQELIKKWKISDPQKVRLQMGLKDRMQKAFFLSGRYLPMMEKIFKEKNLPVELTRLVFVESSFNVFAQSKVGASGLWQIMPAVARPYGYLHKNYDKRNHPFHATRLASEILKSNYKNLRSWPLAVTAYNHGLTGVKKMSQLNRSTAIESLVESEKVTPSWGFASKNFYACFLAVLEVERNARILFGPHLVQSQKINTQELHLTRATSKKKILKFYNGSLTRFKQMNPHLNWTRIMRTQKIPAGIPLNVPSEKYRLASRSL